MAAIYCLAMLLYYALVFKARRHRRADLARLLWAFYFGLGLSALFISATGVLPAVFPPNYGSALFLVLCVLVSIHGFAGFKSEQVSRVVQHRIAGQDLIELFLITSQYLAIAFFLPFAIGSLVGDAGENRLELASKIEVLGSFGLINTAAGAACQLFSASLVMAFIRLSSPKLSRAAVRRALVLTGASLSYVIYILAYVGRDGIVYWIMTTMMVMVVFRPHLSLQARTYIRTAGTGLLALLLVPFVLITVARFVDTDRGTAWSLFDYFGSQINNFSDYSSIDRPLTFGVLSFPVVLDVGCALVGIGCEPWADIKDFIFGIYLGQDKEPWLFGTFISDFVGDFGYAGAFVIVAALSLISRKLIRVARRPRDVSLSRLLLILFLYLIPFWGIFYFRFSIANGYILVNLLFIAMVAVLQKAARPRARQLRGTSLST